MKENKKNKNASKKLVTLASVGLSSAVAFAVAAPLIINAQNSSSKNVSQQPKLALAPANSNDPTEVGIENQAANVSPKYLYSLPVVDSSIDFTSTNNKTVSDLVGYVYRAKRSFSLWKLNDNATLAGKYSDAAAYIGAYSNANQYGGGFDATDQANFDKGVALLTNINEITNNYNAINGIGTTVTDLKKPLQITLPKEVRNVATTNQLAQGVIDTANPADNYLLNTDNFEYKIAEINLDKLKDQRSLVFSFEDQAESTKTGYGDHDYKIVISNENREIDSFLSAKSTDISELIKNQTIFIRDTKATAQQPKTGGRDFSNDALAFSSQKFRFVYDAANKKLSLLAKPNKDNVDDKKLVIGIDSDASDKEAIKSTTTKWGFLDNSLSPSHLKKTTDLASTNNKPFLTDPIDSKVEMVPAGASEILSSDLSVYASKGAWQINDISYKYTGGQGEVKPAANWIRLFLGKNMKLSRPMQFNGKTDSDNFENGSASEFSVQYIDPAGALPAKVEPTSGFVIRSDAAAAAPNIDLKNQRFAVVTDEVKNTTLASTYMDSPDNMYLRTDILLNRGIMSFSSDNNQGENALELTNVAQKIFFENPWSSKVQAIAPKSEQVKEIRTSPQVKETDIDAELLADVIKNWTDKSNITQGAKNQILSYQELIDLLKKDANYKNDFDNLGLKFKAQAKAEADLKFAQATNDATAIQGAESKLNSAQDDVKKASEIILALLPKWPFGQDAALDNVKDTQMVFDESVAPNNATDLQEFVYSYRRFYIDKDTNSLVEDAGNQKTHGIFQQDQNYDFVLDASGNKIPVEADGEAVYKHFLDYTSKMIDWQKNKLGIDETMGLGELKPYDPPKSGVMGWVRTRLIYTAGDEGNELQMVASLLSKIWVSPTVATTPDEDALKTEINKFMPLHWEDAIKNKANDSNYPSGKVDMDSVEYKLSRQYIYMIIQAYYVKVLNKILDIETARLDTNRKLALRETFKKFFADTDNTKKINDTTITKVDTKSTTDLANIELVGVGTYGVSPAKNGLESLKSLLAFIYDAGLQQRFLNNNDNPDTFNAYAKDGAKALDDPQLFLDEQKKNDFVNIMQFAGTIIDKTFDKNQSFVPLNTIIDKINSSAYDKSKDGATALGDLKSTIKYVVETISTSISGYNKLQVFGAEANYTYLQSLTMGKNLNSIFNEYISRKKAENLAANKPENDSLKQVIDFVHESKEYNEKAIASLAVSLGYYNLEYFVENLTNPNKVATMARELLSKDLSKDIQLKVDDSNQLVNIISQPGALAKYAFLGIGASTALIGGSIFGLSFRKSVRTSRKNIIMERAIFVGIAVLGIALALFGIIPGIL